jgi:PilZ domain.
MEKIQSSRCNIKGSGKVINGKSKYAEFDIIELSADNAKILSQNEIEKSTQEKLQIILPAFLFQVKITTDFKVLEKKRQENGFEYYVEFIGLSERDKTEIDEMVRNCRA